MHAIQTNTPELSSAHQLVGDSSTLLALPPPGFSGFPDTLELAAAYTVEQQETLRRMVESLSQLARLAEEGQRHEATEQHRLELHLHFLERANTLARLTQATFRNHPLFSPRDWTVELDPPGNKLLIPGIHRAPQRILSLQQADLLSARSAAETRQRILELLECAAVDQALVGEIHLRLSFLSTAGRRA